MSGNPLGFRTSLREKPAFRQVKKQGGTGMKVNFRLIGKIGLVLVILGFFMPISCDMNGFELAKLMRQADNTLSALLLYLLFISTVAGLVVGVLLLLQKRVGVAADWVTILVCIGSGLVVYFNVLDQSPKLQTGAYVILAGWIVALLAQIVSQVTGER
jgi:hypothetical protein